MGERLLCKQEVIGSIPFTSTRAAAFRGGCGAARARGRVLLDGVKRELNE